jgi:hypothetical protein
MWLAPGGDGYPSRACLTPPTLSSLMRQSVNTNMIRLFGRAPRGERGIGRGPFSAWKTVTFVATLRHDGMTAPMKAPRRPHRRSIRWAMFALLPLALMTDRYRPMMRRLRPGIVVLRAWALEHDRGDFRWPIRPLLWCVAVRNRRFVRFLGQQIQWRVGRHPTSFSPNSCGAKMLTTDLNEDPIVVAYRVEKNSGMDRGDLANLTAFVAVADQRSFRAAATQLGVTSSALRHSMRQLEERLGVLLLQPTTRSVSATDAGATSAQPASAGNR